MCCCCCLSFTAFWYVCVGFVGSYVTRVTVLLVNFSVEQIKIVFNCIFHHDGEFFRDKTMFYRGGIETVVADIEPDSWKVDSIHEIVRTWGYEKEHFRIWCKMDVLGHEFFEVNADHIAEEISIYVVYEQTDAHIYVEHNVRDICVKVLEPQCVNINESSDEDEDNLYMYSSDDGGAKYVRFDDSEDERGGPVNDGFEVVEVDAPMNGSNRVNLGGKSVRIKKCASKSPKKLKLKVSAHQDDEGNDGEEYLSEELESDDPDDFDSEKGPKFEKFRKEQLNKKFEFKLGMEFNSLREFKDAIIEWNVLNGYEFDFIKNESYRVRVVCKSRCGYLVLCSKVGDRHTYQIKTLKPKHTCGKTTKNKSASSRWVANFVVVNKLQTTKKVTITDIMDDMRKNHSVGITMGKAWKAKQIAQEVVEGNADRQYGMIWRYAAELTRVCAANSVKINVDRPSPSLQPRFGSFYFCFDGCKKGFINGCRPFVGVDGCHLKTKYGGQLLIAVGRDPNDQYFPLAFGIVETECKTSWNWFMKLLMNDIGKDKRYVFISDQQKVKLCPLLIYWFVMFLFNNL